MLGGVVGQSENSPFLRLTGLFAEMVRVRCSFTTVGGLRATSSLSVEIPGI